MASRARSKVSSVTWPYTRNVTGRDFTLCPMNEVTPTGEIGMPAETERFRVRVSGPLPAEPSADGEFVMIVRRYGDKSG
jgi:hypothetical protein